MCKIIITESSDFMNNIDKSVLDSYKSRYLSDKTNLAVAGAIAKVGFQDASVNNDILRKHDFVFSNETKRGLITNQKASGRCWMFSALNTARVDTMAALNVDTFEFSQNYTLFWDKLEKSNYFLDSIIATKDEEQGSRVIMHLLSDPVQDGGQWDMFSGILKKYGAVPKSAMPETFHSSNTRLLNNLLTKKLREYARDIRNSKETSVDALKALKEDRIYSIYNILTKALGEVPETFTYEYRDKDNNFHRISNITPVDFFNKYVGWDLDSKVSLINAPTSDKPYGKSYTVKYLGTIKEAKPIQYINVPIEALKAAAINAIKDGHPVWFGCDVGQFSLRDAGIMDLDAFNYDLTIGEDFSLNKAERLDYGESMLTHAMVFVGVDLDDDGNPIKWKVENSWGDKSGDKGIFSMSDAWFDQYNYQIMVDKKYVDAKWLKALDEPVVELEPWDPMGALAVY